MIAAKVLILEDEPYIARDIELTLQDEGYRTVTVLKASDALAAMRQEDAPDLAMLDINLAGDDMDGIEVAKEIIKIKKIPLIFLTAHAHYFDKAREVGPASFLLKGETDIANQIPISVDLAINNFLASENGEPANFNYAPPGKICINYRLKSADGERAYRKVILKKEEILYIKGDGGTLDLYTLKRPESYNLGMPIGIFKDQLDQTLGPDDQSFMQVKKGIIINLDNLSGYDSGHVYFDQAPHGSRPDHKTTSISINRAAFLMLKKFFPPFKTKDY